jgi:methane/ammonia monooxygenase subunit C
MVLCIKPLSEIVLSHQLPLGWGAAAIYDRKIPVLRGPNNSMNTGLKMTILGYLATMFTIGVNEMWHFWFVEEIFAVPKEYMLDS